MRFQIVGLLSLALAAGSCGEARVASDPSDAVISKPPPSKPRMSPVAGSDPFMSKPDVQPDAGSSTARNGLPPGACPAIACANGANVILRKLSRSFEYLRSLSFELCRNDRCNTGRLSSDVEPPPNSNGSGVGLILPDGNIEPGEDRMSFFIMSDGAGDYDLRATWEPWSVDALKDKDRLSIRVTEPSGRRGVLLDVRATYEDNSIKEPCYQHCQLFTLDVRAGGLPPQADEDAGTAQL